MKVVIRKGASVGSWKIVDDKPLGEGGNSVVWRATSEDGREVAIKFLFERLLTTSRYRRFVDEVMFHKAIGARKGILPLVDSYLPDTPSKADRPWLATQLATPLARALAEMRDNLRHTVESIQAIAATLKQIHDEGAAHRDIKPDNLFYLEGCAAIGDFGLVDYPGKQSLTSGSERLGPLFYVAPEMMANADDFDPKPADVYSLAKTLWVLATGQNYPLQGELRTDIPQARVSTYVRDERATILDLLLEQATRHNPADRPTMSAFAAELSAWLSPIRTDALPDLSHLVARFRPLVNQSEAARAVHDTKYKRCEQLISILHDFLNELSGRVNEITGFRSQVHGNTNAMLRYLPYRSGHSSGAMYKQNCSLECLANTTIPGVHVVFSCGFVLDVESDGSAVLTGGLVISMNQRKPNIVRTATCAFPVGSAQEEHELSNLLNDLRNSLPDALSAFADVIATPEKLELV